MTAQTRSDNKANFEQGDVLTGSNFADLIDSFVSIVDTTAQSMSSDLIVPNLTCQSITTVDHIYASALHISAVGTVLNTAQSSAIWSTNAQQGAHGVFGLISVRVGSTSVALVYMHKGTYL